MAYDVMIPGLLPPIEPTAIAEIIEGLELPGLRRLLDATLSASDGTDVDTWLCETFQIPATPDYPMAALARYAKNPDMPTDCWMHADPVHISIRRDQLVLIGPQALNITAAEIDALAPALQEQIPEGYRWEIATSSSWFLHGEKKPETRTVPLGMVEGRPISHALPTGADAAQWRRVMTELQMALHAHDVNAEREARGELPINGVWIWGIGRLPEAIRSPYTGVWSDRALAAGLARRAGVQYDSLPADFAGVARAGGQQLLILDALETAAQYGDWLVWRDALQNLETQWLGPMTRARPSRLWLAGPQRLLTLRPRRSGAWMFWRKPAPVATALQQLMEYR